MMAPKELLTRLESKGITLEKMLDTALELYIGDEREKVRKRLRELMLVSGRHQRPGPAPLGSAP